MIVEVATFRLSVPEAAFLAADRAVQQDFFPHQPGALRRTTARGADGGWLVLTLWHDAESADAADGRARHEPAPVRLAGCLDAASLAVRRYATLD